MPIRQTIKHPIQKHIMGVLTHQKHARFRDMRPRGVDTNAYSYHLKTLVAKQLIDKTEDGYTLGKEGLILASSATPDIVTMFVVQNSSGDVLLYRRTKQPFINLWTLPYGKLHAKDTSIHQAAIRDLSEKFGLKNVPAEHAGECYIRTLIDGEVAMTTLVHAFRFETDDIEMNDHLQWARPHKLNQLELAPAVEQIIARTFFRDPFYFEEYTEELSV